MLQWLQEIQPGFQQRLLGEKCSGYNKWHRGNWRIWGATSRSHHFRCRGGQQKDQGLFHPLRWVLNLVKKCQRQEDGIIPLVHNTTKTTSSTRITVVCNSKRPKVSQSLKPRTSTSHTNVLLYLRQLCNREWRVVILLAGISVLCTVFTTDWRTKVHSCAIMQRPSWLKCFNKKNLLCTNGCALKTKFYFDLMISRVISRGRLGQGKIYQFWVKW